MVSKCGSLSENEKNRGETGRERQTKLGHVTWLGLTVGRIKYPTACGHLHNKCSFHFINYFSSTGTEARHSKREAAPYSGRLFIEYKSGALKTWATRSLRDGKQSGSLRYHENDHNRRKRGSSVWWLHCDRLIALSICFEKAKDGETNKQSMLKKKTGLSTAVQFEAFPIIKKKKMFCFAWMQIYWPLNLCSNLWVYHNISWHNSLFLVPLINAAQTANHAEN